MPALAGRIDLVVHGGDLLYRSRVRRQLVLDAFEPLKRVAEAGVPVVLVPGNHERSSIPFPLLGAHPGVHVFRRPETFRLEIRGQRVAVAGFPCCRRGVAASFRGLVRRTGWSAEPADVRLLCIHQTVEGARVGPAGFTFRRGGDVIRGADLPAGFAAVLAGHIHRWQVLERDLRGRPLAAPVFYPGSIERTSFAERNETKGFLTVEIAPSGDGGRVERWVLHPLPARPMREISLDVGICRNDAARADLERRLRELPADAVVRLRLVGSPPPGSDWPSASELRMAAPPSMILEPRRPDARRPPREEAAPDDAADHAARGSSSGR